jgi:hypothetical protein
MGQKGRAVDETVIPAEYAQGFLLPFVGYDVRLAAPKDHRHMLLEEGMQDLLGLRALSDKHDLLAHDVRRLDLKLDLAEKGMSLLRDLAIKREQVCSVLWHPFESEHTRERGKSPPLDKSYCGLSQ